MRLTLSFSPRDDGSIPPLPDAWREIIEQASKKRRATVSTMPETRFSLSKLEKPDNDNTSTFEASILPSEETARDRKIPSIAVEYCDGRKMSVEDLRGAPSSTCSSPTRRPKRRLHQQYRPPTPPLPAYAQKQRLVASESESIHFYSTKQPCSTPSGTLEGPCPPPCRVPSMKASSFSTIGTKSPSFQTEKTYSSFGNSEPSTLWSTTYADSRPGLHVLPALPKHVGHVQESRPNTSYCALKAPLFSCWRRMEAWSTYLGMKLRSLSSLFFC
ncbi:hypothetical protein Hypma_010120 [Hypsizygus marmoreus]|uniref:Uncharacterized protein n=1 Tax=Hypsizygus marmoreus TaxID=39966 RepID=A0A369JKG2_HYPMA|nr:hypothetical protein Hypma_010120 [Hypsizygus marmoreus]